MESIISRIKEIIAHYKLSDRQFALKCGVPANTLSNQLSGERKISGILILNIAQVFPEISAEWFLRGDGPMFIESLPTLAETSTSAKKITDIVVTLSQVVNEQEAEIGRLREELKKK